MNLSKTSSPKKYSVTIRRAVKSDGKTLLYLINALADYEKLARPDKAGCTRLLRDAFGKRKLFYVFLAFEGKTAIGYAIYYYTYSSFLALTTLYLEDLFVLPGYRKKRAGWKLFQACVREAKTQGCGRMEWMVLEWNKLAIDFYDRLGAKQLDGWLPYRLERIQFKKLLS
ncbi:MAG: GNAT family N-acetyltransferase [Bacteroidota bacterium]